MIYFDHFLLAHANGACDGLIHKGGGPPGTDEQNAVVFLEIQSHPTCMELKEKHRRFRSLFGVSQHGGPLCLRQSTMVHKNMVVLRQFLFQEELADQCHLIDELAEDDVFVDTRVFFDNRLYPFHLGTGQRPVGTAIMRVFPSFRVDVHLGMNRDLS